MDTCFLVSVIVLWIITLKFQHVSSCDGYTTLTNTQGHIASPRYPSFNPKASRCHWLIHVDQGYIIILEFQAFDVGQNTECSTRESRRTFLEVRDGASNVSLGIYCGSRTPNIVSTSGNKMWVEYVTNGYSSTKFVARYHTTKEYSMTLIVLLSLAAIFGTVLSVVFIIVLIKRNSKETDDDISHVTPSHGMASNNGTCSLAHIPSLTQVGNVNEGMDDYVKFPSNENNQHSCNHDNENHCHCYCTVESYDSKCHRIDRCHDNINHNDGSNPRHEPITVIDMDCAHAPKQDRLSPQLLDTNTRKTSESESILTTAKVIFVRDSSSSRSSSTSSNEQ